MEESVLAVVRHHLRPGLLWREVERGALDGAGYANAVRRLVRAVVLASWAAFLAVAEAGCAWPWGVECRRILSFGRPDVPLIRAMGWDAAIPVRCFRAGMRSRLASRRARHRTSHRGGRGLARRREGHDAR